MDIYKQFGTDPSREQEGVVLNYSDLFWVKIARAGGANERYKTVLTELLRPHRRAIQTETLTEEMGSKLLRQAYARAVVLDWGSTEYGPGLMPNKDGGAPLDCTPENVEKFFLDLPEIFADVQEQAGRVALFRETLAEHDAGNS